MLMMILEVLKPTGMLMITLGILDELGLAVGKSLEGSGVQRSGTVVDGASEHGPPPSPPSSSTSAFRRTASSDG